MNQEDKQHAIRSADLLLGDLIKSQPELFKGVAPSESAGEHAGKFIAALRDQLIAMYEKTPR